MWSCGALGCCEDAQVTSQDPGADFPATGHKNINFYSVAFAVRSSSPNCTLGVHSIKAWIQVQSGSGDVDR